MSIETMTREERIEFYSTKILDIRARKEELEEAEKNHRAALAELVEDGDNFVGEFKINRRTNRRFDAKLAKKNLSEKELKKISVSKPDPTLAKAVLDEDRLALCQKTFGVVVQVGLRND